MTNDVGPQTLDVGQLYVQQIAHITNLHDLQNGVHEILIQKPHLQER